MTANRRVLHLIPAMGGGGAERQLTYIARGQMALGWDVHVATARDGANYAHLVESGATIHRLRAQRDPRLVGQVLSLIRRLRPGIVHTRMQEMDILGGAAARLCGTPWVLSERSSAVAYRGGLKGPLRNFVARFAAAIDANSAKGAEYWAETQPRIAVRVVSSGLPFEQIAATPARELRPPRSSPDAPVILFAGRLSIEKNVLNVLRAVHRVLQRREAVAVICGTGPQDGEARRLAAALGIEDRVHFAGFDPDVWGLMKTADVFVAPSVFEGRPNAVLEAAACRCPLVVSDIAQHHEFLGGDAALFVPWNDVDGIAAALLDTVTGRARAASRAENAFRGVSRFTIPEMARQLDALYADVLAGAGR